MSKVITIAGGTGIQGGSVARALLDNPTYSIRVITRNTEGDAAKALAAKGVDVVEADLNSVDSLRSAFAGSHAIFAVTNFFDALETLGIEKSMELETRLGINLAEAAAATKSLEHYVWSTLPNSRHNSGGKAVVPYYDSKNRVDDYIKSIPHLLRMTTFIWLGWYAGNMRYPMYSPTPICTIDGTKSYVQFLAVPPSTIMPLLGDEKVNVGIFVKAILEQPQKTLPGKFVAGVVEYQTFSDMLSSFATAQDKQARWLKVGREDYTKLWPIWGELMDATHHYFDMSDGKPFASAEDDVLTKEDLNLKGLVGSAEAFSGMRLLD